jgi:hypothetical protein
MKDLASKSGSHCFFSFFKLQNKKLSPNPAIRRYPTFRRFLASLASLASRKRNYVERRLASFTWSRDWHSLQASAEHRRKPVCSKTKISSSGYCMLKRIFLKVFEDFICFKYAQWRCILDLDKSTALNTDIKTWHPGVIRTRNLPFWRQMRWPLCRAAKACIVNSKK